MAIWWNAVSGGAFYTRWSALTSLIVAALFSVPTVGTPDLDGYLRAVAVAALGWLPLAALIVPVVVAELRSRHAPLRGALVILSLVVVSALRPGINDTLSRALFDVTPTGAPMARVLTNLATALALFSIVAVITSRHAASRAAKARLDIAFTHLRADGTARAEHARRLRQAIVDTADSLRVERDAMLAGTIDFDGVRAYADRVRGASHRLDALVRAAPQAGVDAGGSVSAGRGEQSRPHTRATHGPLRLPAPPWLSVLGLYGCVCFPFAVVVGGPFIAATGVLGGLLLDLATGAVLRRGAPATRRIAVFVATWASSGTVMAVLTILLLPGIGFLAAVPVLAVPVVAVLLSLCRDALQRVRRDEERAATSLVDAATRSAAAAHRADAESARAVDVLHGRVQGACVVFAAAVDERAAEPADASAFIARTDRAFDELIAPQPAATISVRTALGELVGAWSSVLDVAVRLDPVAEAALDTASPERVVDIVVSTVNEAFVNAVKHSAARRARVEVEPSPHAGGIVLVRVSAPGSLDPRARRGLGSASARVFADGGEVVFERRIAVIRQHVSGVTQVGPWIT
ncbi:hypothetical protein [Microbacterium sp. cf332]|uniref:hypothetical protein n=1 Tax=Microbacterium sp. cf332 TaxID=1761804 RepID=UPI00087FD708|nr:hypothetical protein [Microbacterium sp. cf332]SDQ97107.1 Signal transduction histidine kinase [Microbacterium sp. cf332]